MKKLLILLSLLIVTPTFAVDRYGHIIDFKKGYDQGYNIGYDCGKNDNKTKTWKIVGASVLVVIGGVIIYEVIKESRWAVTENGLAYRF